MATVQYGKEVIENVRDIQIIEAANKLYMRFDILAHAERLEFNLPKKLKIDIDSEVLNSVSTLGEVEVFGDVETVSTGGYTYIDGLLLYANSNSYIMTKLKSNASFPYRMKFRDSSVRASILHIKGDLNSISCFEIDIPMKTIIRCRKPLNMLQTNESALIKGRVTKIIATQGVFIRDKRR